MKYSVNSNGNVLFFILIAVALFAGLSYAVSNSFQGGGNTISTEQSKIGAGQILRNMQDIKAGYDYLWNQQGCSLDAIEFDNPATTGTNCQMFHALGAGVSYPNNLARFQTTGGAGTYTFYYIGSSPTGAYGVEEVGTASSDHMVLLTGVSAGVCQGVNRLLGYDNPLDDIIDAAGTVSNGDVMGNVANEFDGRTAGCRARAAGGPYDVWMVIQAL